MASYPKGYEWLGTIGPLPRIVAVALADHGVREMAGAGNNPVILRWAEQLGGQVAREYRADSIAWCGLAVAHWVQVAGKMPPPSTPLWARSWAGYGTSAHRPQLGDVLVFARDGGGHVGIYIAEDSAAYHVLGGNQGDAVSIARIAKSRLIAARRPPFRTALPASARPYRVATGGALSTNEA